MHTLIVVGIVIAVMVCVALLSMAMKRKTYLSSIRSMRKEQNGMILDITTKRHSQFNTPSVEQIKEANEAANAVGQPSVEQNKSEPTHQTQLRFNAARGHLKYDISEGLKKLNYDNQRARYERENKKRQSESKAKLNKEIIDRVADVADAEIRRALRKKRNEARQKTFLSKLGERLNRIHDMTTYVPTKYQAPPRMRPMPRVSGSTLKPGYVPTNADWARWTRAASARGVASELGQ